MDSVILPVLTQADVLALICIVICTPGEPRPVYQSRQKQHFLPQPAHVWFVRWSPASSRSHGPGGVAKVNVEHRLMHSFNEELISSLLFFVFFFSCFSFLARERSWLSPQDCSSSLAVQLHRSNNQAGRERGSTKAHAGRSDSQAGSFRRARRRLPPASSTASPGCWVRLDTASSDANVL